MTYSALWHKTCPPVRESKGEIPSRLHPTCRDALSLMSLTPSFSAQGVVLVKLKGLRDRRQVSQVGDLLIFREAQQGRYVGGKFYPLLKLH